MATKHRVACIPVWKVLAHGHKACISQTYAQEMARRTGPRRAKVGIPCWNRTSLCGFANRRLSCSANGIETESAGGSFHFRLR